MNFVHVVSIVVMMICLEIQAQNFTCPYEDGVQCLILDACCPANFTCVEISQLAFTCVPFPTAKPDNFICKYPDGVRCQLGQFCCPKQYVCVGLGQVQLCI